MKSATAKKPQATQKLDKKDLTPAEHNGLPVPELSDSVYYCNWHYSVFCPDDELEDLVQCFDELSFLMEAWGSEERSDEKQFWRLIGYLSNRLEIVKKALRHYHKVPNDLIKGDDLAKLLEQYSKGGAA